MATKTSANRVIVRERIGQMGSIVGAIGLVLGIIGLIWQGGLSSTVITLLVVGIIGLVVWIVAAPDDARALLTGRGARFGTVTVFSLAFLISVVVLVYLFIQGRVLTLDMTTSNRFTLSRETLNVLERIERDIQITGFYSSAELPQRELDDEIFRLYSDQSDGRIKRVYINPQDQPAVAQSFGMTYDGQVFLSFVDENGEVDYDSVLAVPRESAQERDLTTTLLLLLNTGEFRVAFEVGYSNFTAEDESAQGFTRIINGMVTNGIDFGYVNLRNAVEQDLRLQSAIDVIVLLRMNTELPDEAVAILDDYLSQGGSLLILADVTDENFLREESLFNAYLWDRYGVRMLDAVAVDAVSRGASDLDILSYAVGGGNSITERLNLEGQDDTRALFKLARPVEINRTPPVPNGFVVGTSSASYGERDIERVLRSNEFQYDDGDVEGPLNVAAYANNEENGSKILIIGDSDFVMNGQVASPLGNSLLFTDGIAWLSGLNDRLIFTPEGRVTNLPLVFLSTQSLDQIAFFTIVLMPGTMLAAGFFVWLRRSRR